MLNLIYNKKYLYMTFSCILLVLSLLGFFSFNSIHNNDSIDIYNKIKVEKVIILNTIFRNIDMNNRININK